HSNREVGIAVGREVGPGICAPHETPISALDVSWDYNGLPTSPAIEAHPDHEPSEKEVDVLSPHAHNIVRISGIDDNPGFDLTAREVGWATGAQRARP